MPSTPASSSRRSVCVAASDSWVVHVWPCQPTYWRSSSHTGQAPGVAAASAYCVPQVSQMARGIDAPSFGRAIERRPCGSRELGLACIDVFDTVVHALRDVAGRDTLEPSRQM